MPALRSAEDVTGLYAPGCSIAPTRRRRFLWAAWWTAPPEREPYRKPDAWQGGARTREEARCAAERAAGLSLVELDSSWARAWMRLLDGHGPWRSTTHGDLREKQAHRGAPRQTSNPSVWAVLGLTSAATDQDIKRAYRARALLVHPDRGGSVEEFRALQRAYEEALLRRMRRKAGPNPR